MVTILMAVYQGQGYLQEQLNSLREQTNTHWQLLVRDDGSNDSSLEILREFSNQVEQNVSIIENHPPTGSAKNNFSLLLQDGLDEETDYFMCCDQDDIWKSDKIEKTLTKMQQMEREYGTSVPLLVHTDLEVADSEGNSLAESFFTLSGIPQEPSLNQLLIQNHVTGCTMMINKPLLEAVAETAGEETVIMHDYWAALYAKVFGYIGFCNESLIWYRQHGDNSVGAKDSHSFSYLLKRLRAGRMDYHRAMVDSFYQTLRFIQCYEDRLQGDDWQQECDLMKGYADLINAGKGKRIGYYIKYHIWKKGLVRKIMQCLWG